uniref:Acetyl-coenzyme A carboxylase carboxyl transferase subunit beta, chloroplastic n=1 Tax=Passiflora laurifolia TaxID=237862 RepID=A0A2Z5D4Y2_PASLR|nr:acetyl-CoA carboxylase carboxyltransferase beta subunit [Passiflora laurifolia]AXB37667.1 acetyl-CoA carboxylase carboxyltransferase beta subunit [Passiflora laurifolia]
MANLNKKILWTPCCSNRDPDPLENQNKENQNKENQNKENQNKENQNKNDIETENTVSEITNDPFFLSMIDSSFTRYFNYGYRKRVIENMIDSIIDNFLDDLIASASANEKNGSIDPNHNSDNHSSDNHNGESEDPSTNDNSDTNNRENEEPSTSGNSDDSVSQNGRPSRNTNQNNARPLRIWVWTSGDANSDDGPNPNGIRNPSLDNGRLFGNDYFDDFGSQNVSLFGTSTNDNSDDHKGENEEPSTNDNSDDRKGENEEPSTNDNSDDHKGENEEPSTNDNSDDRKGENEEPSTNERKTIDYGALWVQCETCYGVNYKRVFFTSRLNICEYCGCHLRVDSPERIELSIDPGTWDPMDEAGKEDSIDPGTKEDSIDPGTKEDSIDPGTKEDSIDPGTWDPMDEAGKEDEYMSVLDPIEWDWDPESEDDENEEDSEDEWDLDSDLYSYSDPDPNTDPEEKEESDPDEEDPEEEEKEEEEKEEEEKEEEEKEEEEKEEEEWEEEEWDEEESDEEEWDAWDRDEWDPWDPEEHERKKKKKEDPEEEEDWSWLLIEEEEVEVEDKPYLERIFACQDETELSEAVQTGIGQINGIPVAIGVMDFRFIGGSMGCIVGEKITRLIEYATNQILPLILVCASGGARMYEGSLSLMQMAKISAALYNYKSNKNKKSFYISILTTPTTGGVTASFGMLGDIIISEPDAYIAFAGKRVIEQTLNIEVPEGSQTAEVLFENGLLDPIVPRNLLKGVLYELLQLHNFRPLNKKE